MNAPFKDAVTKALALAAAAAAGFGIAVRLLRDDPSFPGPAAVALLASALLAAGFLILAASLRGKTLLRFPLLWILALLVPALGGVSALLASPRPHAGLSFLAAFGGAFLFFPVAVQAGRDREFSKTLLKGALGIVAVQVLVGFFQFSRDASGEGGIPFRGIFDSPLHAAGILAMAIPAVAGLLVNSLQERMDPAVWPRRILYGLTAVLFAAGLYYAGSETAWVALALGGAAFLALAGRTPVRRNLRVILPLAAFVAAAAAGAAALQSRPGFRMPGYGTLLEQTGAAARSARTDAEAAVRSPRFGDGFLAEGRRPAGPPARRAPAAASSPARLAAAGGLPFLAALVLLLAAAFAAAAKGSRIREAPPPSSPVMVGRRRAVKAIEIASAAAVGGTAAFLLAAEGVPGLPRPVFLAVFLPLWLAFTATVYSYKHFRRVSEDRRDFVAIGAASGAAAGLLRSLAGDDLLHPPTLFFLLLLLAVAVSRAYPPEAGRAWDLRRPKLLRAALGILGLLTVLAGAALLVRQWEPETRRAAEALEAPAEDGTSQGPASEGRGP
jgi:hypothetical protein